ncbi:MAG: hypothetical protein WB660_26320 [Candidatus Sulfotelmatobacter sp.]
MKTPEPIRGCNIVAGRHSPGEGTLCQEKTLWCWRVARWPCSSLLGLGEASYSPERLHSFLHYIDQEPGTATFLEYRWHYDLITLGFLVIRVVGFSLMAKWLYKGGPEVEELLSPPAAQEKTVLN